MWYLDDDGSIYQYETTPLVGSSGEASNRIMKVAGTSPTVTLTTLIKNFVLSVIPLGQRFSNCGPRTTSGHRVLPLWSF